MQLRPRNRLTYVLLAIGVVLLCASAFALFAPDGDGPIDLTMTAGSLYKTRYRLAMHICDEAQDQNLSIEVVESAGSVEAIDLVEAGEVDLALVQGGIGLENHPHVRQLAALCIEPLHLLVKEPLATDVQENLVALRGRTIDMSRPGSGTYLLAAQVLEFAGLHPAREGRAGDYSTVEGSYNELLDQLAELDNASGTQRDDDLQHLPDAIFLVSAIPSELAKRLVTIGGYRLVRLQFGEAFSLISVEEATDDHDRIAQAFIHTTEIPAFAYSVDPPVPSEPCVTLGTRLLFIAHEDVPADAIERLCEVVHEGSLPRLCDIPASTEIAPEYERHVGAINYSDRDKPIIRAELIDFLQTLASVFGPALGGLLAIYGFIRWRQTLRFQHYLHELCRIQGLATGRIIDAGLPPATAARLIHLERRLDELQQHAVEEFSRRYFHGEGVMEILLALLADVRGGSFKTQFGLRDGASVA